MLISLSQINQLLIYADCYKNLLFKMQNDQHTEYSLRVEEFLEKIELQQKEDLRRIE